MPRTSLKSHYGDRPLPFCHLTLKDWLPILLLPPAELGTYVAWFTLYHANGKAPVPIADLCRLLGAYRKTVDRLLASLLERKLIWIGDGAIRQGRACLEEIEVPERFRHVLDGVEYPVRYVAFWVDRWRAALDRLNPQEFGVYLRLWVFVPHPVGHGREPGRPARPQPVHPQDHLGRDRDEAGRPRPDPGPERADRGAVRPCRGQEDA